MKMMDWREAKLGAGVNPGWEPLVDELHRRVLEVAPQVEVIQVKEKFGRLRYYYGLPEVPGYDEVGRLVQQAEIVSGWICEVCGKPGHTDQWGESYWVNTLCEQHGKIRAETGTPAWQIAQQEQKQALAGVEHDDTVGRG